jgi:hypothetical protein
MFSKPTSFPTAVTTAISLVRDTAGKDDQRELGGLMQSTTIF